MGPGFNQVKRYDAMYSLRGSLSLKKKKNKEKENYDGISLPFLFFIFYLFIYLFLCNCDALAFALLWTKDYNICNFHVKSSFINF